MKPKTIEQLSAAFLSKFGSVNSTREGDYLRYAFMKGYRAGYRRGKRKN